MVIGVAIVGLGDEGWAANSHLLALKQLESKYVITGVLNSKRESSQRAIEKHNLTNATAFDTIDEVVKAENVDVVLVSVKIPQHYDIAMPVVAAGKGLYVEWAVGRTLDEAKEIAEVAVKYPESRTVVGLQSRKSPGILKIKEIVESGKLGRILQVHITGYAFNWGSTYSLGPSRSYMNDKDSGASLLTIPVGHTLDAVRYVVGNLKSLNAQLLTQHPELDVVGSDGTGPTGEKVPRTVPDNVAIVGQFDNGAALSLHVNGGASAGVSEGLRWEIHGTKGDLLITGIRASTQMSDLKVKFASAGDPGNLQAVEITTSNPVVGNVRALWEAFHDDTQDELEGQKLNVKGYPSLQDGVRLHELIAAIQESASSGRRVNLS